MEVFNLFIITYSLVTFYSANEVDYHVFMYVCILVLVYVFSRLNGRRYKTSKLLSWARWKR